jgi:hypothetical protein
VVGKERCPIVDTWWQTETGGHLITPLPGAHTLKPGSASRPFFGVEPVILRDDGTPCGPNEGGKLCIKKPWPGIMRTTWGDHDRFIDNYFQMVPNLYFTGDGCRTDADGDYWLMGRIDDVVNVSRPGPWGNPFVPEAGPGGWLLAVVGKARGDARVMDIARKINEGGALAHRAASVVMAVEAFRTLHDNELSRQSMRHHLQGKGVACWCKVGDPCHGDVLLEFANPSPPTTCGQSPADATAEKSDLSAPGAPRNAAPAAAGENTDPAEPTECPECWEPVGNGAMVYECDNCGADCCTACSHDGPDGGVVCDLCQEDPEP